MAATGHIKTARESMQSLQIYKPEFDPMIKVYGELQDQLEVLTKQYKKSGYKCDETTAAGSKKAPIVTTLEALRKDILAYASQLGLTPQGLLKADENAFAKQKKSGLGAALAAIDPFQVKETAGSG